MDRYPLNKVDLRVTELLEWFNRILGIYMNEKGGVFARQMVNRPFYKEWVLICKYEICEFHRP